jgi:hypothetical protein
MRPGRAAAAILAVGMVLGAVGQGPVLADPGAPVITAVSAILPSAQQTITIRGSGFGHLPAYDGDSPWLEIVDLTANWTAGYVDPLGNADGVTVDVTSWSDGEIVLGGLGGIYGAGVLNRYVLSPGDTIEIGVWNPQTGAGPAYYYAGVLSAVQPPSAPAVSGTLPASSGSGAAPSASSSPSVFWSVPFTETDNQITIPCALDGVPFRCFIDTGNGLSIVVPGPVGDRLGVPQAESFAVDGIAGTTAAYAGTGSVEVGGVVAETLITVAEQDSMPDPNIGIPLLEQLCEGGRAAVQIDWRQDTVSCVTG